jgi:hypothetical protein
VTLASGVGCNSLAVGSSFVVWDDLQGIESVPIDGGQRSPWSPTRTAPTPPSPSTAASRTGPRARR